MSGNPSKAHLQMISDDRVISMGRGLAEIPEKLLLAHARGEVLFICGAGISRHAELPDFRRLVIDVYEKLDAPTHRVLVNVPSGACNQWLADCADLTDQQAAEVRRFIAGDYDVVLGMLERRIDDKTKSNSQVRTVIAETLRTRSKQPADIHRTMISLSDRGGACAIATTNFDLLLEAAADRRRSEITAYSLGSIPRPSKRPDFSGVFHIHGALDRGNGRVSELVLTDQDFGEFYLRRRVIPDFIYDAARLYHLVLVGYSANDPPMRYLLNAVAADGTRFDDVKERYTFIGTSGHDAVVIADWRSRGIIPIPYDAGSQHEALRDTLKRWATLSVHNGKSRAVEIELRRIVKRPRSRAEEHDRRLFDHLFRRGNANERVRLAKIVSSAKADIDWLNAIVEVSAEPSRGSIG